MAKPKAKKRKKVLVSAAVRQQDGKPTEPYRIMQELIDEHRPDLTDAKIEILWRSGWRADADGWVQIVAVKKAGDVDRALSVKADFALLLNKENFPRLSERLKTVYLHHALCHMKPMMDSDGEQKQDDKGRLQWRIVKRHDIEQFSELVTIYGNDCLQLDSEAKAAIAAAERPLIAKAEEAEAERANGAKSADEPAAAGSVAAAGDDESWKREPLGVLDLDDAVETFIADAGHKTIGSFSDYMADKGQFWAKDMTVGGRRKPANFQQKVEDAWAAFWAKRGAGKHDAAAATDAKW